MLLLWTNSRRQRCSISGTHTYAVHMLVLHSCTQLCSASDLWTKLHKCVPILKRVWKHGTRCTFIAEIRTCVRAVYPCWLSTSAFDNISPCNIFSWEAHELPKPECDFDGRKKKKEEGSRLRRFKTSILLSLSGTCCSTYREDKRTISPAACALRAQIWLFSSPVVTQNLIFAFLPKQTRNTIFSLFWHRAEWLHRSDVPREKQNGGEKKSWFVDAV